MCVGGDEKDNGGDEEPLRDRSRRSSRVGKRKLFGHDEDSTATSSQELYNIIHAQDSMEQLNSSTEQLNPANSGLLNMIQAGMAESPLPNNDRFNSLNLSSVAINQNEPQEANFEKSGEKSGEMAKNAPPIPPSFSARPLKMQMVKKDFYSPKTAKKLEVMNQIASPETEKTVASLLLTFGNSPSGQLFAN